MLDVVLYENIDCALLFYALSFLNVFYCRFAISHKYLLNGMCVGDVLVGMTHIKPKVVKH